MLNDTHDRACQGFAPGGELLYGRDGLVDFLTGMRAAIPDGVYQVHHWIEERERTKRIRELHFGGRWPAPIQATDDLALPLGRRL